MMIDLPPVDVGVPLTLVITFTDGMKLKVPYIDREGATEYINIRKRSIESYHTETYKG